MNNLHNTIFAQAADLNRAMASGIATGEALSAVRVKALADALRDLCDAVDEYEEDGSPYDAIGVALVKARDVLSKAEP